MTYGHPLWTQRTAIAAASELLGVGFCGDKRRRAEPNELEGCVAKPDASGIAKVEE